MEDMACCQNGLSVVVEVYFVSELVSVSAYYFFLVRIPYNQLLVALLHRVELVDIESLAGTTSGCAECLLALSAYLAHDIWRIMIVYNIYFVIALVCHPQLLVGSEFAAKQCLVYWWYDILHKLLFVEFYFCLFCLDEIFIFLPFSSFLSPMVPLS